jgi:hypothetical protein
LGLKRWLMVPFEAGDALPKLSNDPS